jgi:DNA-binding NarL/FixJ family response regulator
MKTPYTPLRIILADDHEIFRDGFQSLLQNQSHITLMAEAADGQQLVRLTEKHLPDVILTDIQMPVMDGLQATRIIAAKYPQVGIIALTMFSNDNMIIEMLEAGALGYLLKNAHKSEIVEAINTVAMHKPFYCNTTEIKMARLIANSRFNPNDPSKKNTVLRPGKRNHCFNMP